MQIEQLLEKAEFLQLTDPVARVSYFSQLFLGAPYLVGSLGEGESGIFDQSPLYRFDYFDCLTYVNTVLALAYASTAAEFKSRLLQLNYYDAEPDYLKRFHFMSLDWNPQNECAGFLRNITREIVNEQEAPFFETATIDINKGAWLRKRTLADLKLITPLSDDAAQQLLAQLHQAGDQFDKQSVTIEYLPIKFFFDEHEQPIQALFDHIPDAAIVEIVRPCWDLREQIGTHLHVSHLGFAIRTERGLMYRQASSAAGGVVDVPLASYLQQTLTSPTIKGIHVQIQLSAFYTIKPGNSQLQVSLQLAGGLTNR